MSLIDTPSKVYRRALADALGFPSIMLLASMLGFGSLAKDTGFTLGMAMASTAGIWGLPGQVAMAELYTAGMSTLFIVLAVSLANARFLPMAVSFIPHIRSGAKRFGWMFLFVQLLSINTWAAGLRSFPDMTEPMRLRYYLLFSAVCMTAGLVGTAIGYFGIGVIHPSAALGLLFLNPLFFAILLASARARPAILAMMIGIPLGPIMHLISADWGLLATGLVGGTVAFLIHRRLPATA